MILIIGGAYQGKLSWAVSEYGLKDNEILDLSAEDPRAGFRCYTHLEDLTRRHEDITGFIPLFRDAIVISREVGCGVVPMDAAERAWRERHGVTVKALAGDADCVIRILCGLPEVIK